MQNKRDFREFAAQTLHELADRAKRLDLNLLAYLLTMAAIEAADIETETA